MTLLWPHKFPTPVVCDVCRKPISTGVALPVYDGPKWVAMRHESCPEVAA